MGHAVLFYNHHQNVGAPLNNWWLYFLSKISINISKTGSNKRFTHQTLWKKNLICVVRICCNAVKVPILPCARSRATEKKTHAGTVGGGLPIELNPTPFLYRLPHLKEQPARGKACWEEKAPRGSSWLR